MEHIRFYCGLSHKRWHHHLCDPGPFVCISPIIGAGGRTFRATSVYVPPGTEVLQDSGAFGEPLGKRRLTFTEALWRMDRHADQYHYADKIAFRASYDLLIDHRLSESQGKRRKILRISESDGAQSVAVTIEAARFMNRHRRGHPLALNVQGVTPAQYLSCVEQVVPLLRDGDLLGLGGWCVLGRLPGLMADFLETLALVMPFLAREQVPRVHIYGCLYTPALAALLAICDQYGIALSTDSAFPIFGPRVGVWGYGSWRVKQYRRPPVLPSCYDESCAPGTRCSGLECIRHVRLTRAWLAHFRDREPGLYGMYARNIDQYKLGQILDLDLSDIYDEKEDCDGCQ